MTPRTCIFMFFLSPLVLSAQEMQTKQQISFTLGSARRFQDRGDYVFAALLFSDVGRSSQDSNEVAEAAYRFSKCGDEIAAMLTNRIQSAFGSNSRVDSLWHTILEPASNRQIDECSRIGFSIKQEYLYEPFYVNVDTITLRYLSRFYANTKWGERASFDLITYDLTTGTPGETTPELALERAQRFIARYPTSELINDVYYNMANAHQDLWNDKEPDDTTRPSPAQELRDPNPHRLEAIRLLKLVSANRDKLRVIKWSKDSENELERLEKGEYTHVFRFYHMD